MPDIVNTDQAKFWTEEVGAAWAQRGADMNALLANTTDVLMAAADPRPGEAVLDIGCGPGPSSFAAADLVGPSGKVQGVDISDVFIEQARSAAANAPHVTFEYADAQVAKFEPGAFDLVISRFGVMFFNDPTAALANIRHALKPGGRLVIVCWSGPQHNPWFGMTRQVAIDRLGPVDPPPPDAPGPLAFRDIERVTGLLSAAGYSNAEGEETDTRLVYPGSAADLADLATEMGGGGAVVRERGADEADLAAIRRELEDRLGVWAKSDGIRVPARLNIFRALRPAA